MKDPLRNKRTSPKETKQKSVTIQETSTSETMWKILGVVVLIVIIFFGYQYYLNTKQQKTEVDETVEYQEQKEVLEKFESSSSGLSESQREEKIKNFFEISQ